MGAFALVVCGAVALLVGIGRGAWLQGLLAGIALAMALLPEEFPLVLTVFMVMGAWRLSKAKVLTRRASAIETLGSATVLCTDKTGTLTQNRMRVVAAWTGEKTIEWPADRVPPDSTRELLRTCLLASAEHPFDPMERAFHDACADEPSPSSAGLRLEETYGLHARADGGHQPVGADRWPSQADCLQRRARGHTSPLRLIRHGEGAGDGSCRGNGGDGHARARRRRRRGSGRLAAV